MYILELKWKAYTKKVWICWICNRIQPNNIFWSTKNLKTHLKMKYALQCPSMEIEPVLLSANVFIITSEILVKKECDDGTQ